MKFGREEEGRRSEGGRQQECESLDQICPSSLSDPATGLLMRPGTRPITRAQCTQHCTTCFTLEKGTTRSTLEKC